MIISIIIPTFNRVELISETLDSVRLQTYQKWECIIVDDGSTDGTQQVIWEYVNKDKRFSFIQRYRDPKGAPTCRNIGIEKSTGDYIIFLDSDDLLTENCLEKRLELILKNPGFDFWVFRTAQFKISQGDSNTTWNLLIKEMDDLQRFILGDLPWCTTGPIWLKETLIEIGGFDETALCYQDWELHIRVLIKKYKYCKSSDEYIDSYYRNDQLNKQNTISKHHFSLYQIISRIELFENIYLQVIAVDNRKEIKDAFCVLFFRLFIELHQHENKQHLYKMHKLLNQLRIFNFIEVILLRMLIVILINKRINNRFYKNIIKFLVLINKNKFNNTANNTFQS